MLTFIFRGIGVYKSEAQLFIQPELSTEFASLIWVLSVLFMFTE